MEIQSLGGGYIPESRFAVALHRRLRATFLSTHLML